MSDENRFLNTIVAVDEYERTLPRREEMFNKIANMNDFYAWERAEKEALERVQRAFHKDTSGYNSLDNCLRCGIDYMRRIANQYRK